MTVLNISDNDYGLQIFVPIASTVREITFAKVYNKGIIIESHRDI